MKGNQIDLSSEIASQRPIQTATGRPFIGVKFECCSLYSRVYRNQAENAYEGRCPRCAKPVRFPIGPGGTSSRFFSAS